MYMLLYVDSNKQPRYILGSIDEINDELQTLWMNGDIDRDDWEQYSNWELLGIESGSFTPMGNVECTSIPYFEVY
jgi:hypothetical protein